MIGNRGSKQCLFYLSNDKSSTRLVCHDSNYVHIDFVNVQLCVKSQVSWHPKRPAYMNRDLVFFENLTQHIFLSLLLIDNLCRMCRTMGVLFLCLFQKSWLENQDTGFRNRAIKHSLKTRQLIHGYRGSTKMNKTMGPPPCTLRQPWVSVM